jgi:hypothetical protein
MFRLSILYTFTNKIDAQLLEIAVASSFIAEACLVSIFSAVPMNLGNQYQSYSSILGIGCSARPFSIQIGSRGTQMESIKGISSLPR